MKDKLQLNEHVHEAIKATEQKYKVLFNDTNDGIFLHELTEDGRPGKFVEVNDRACKMTGYSRDELLALTPLDIDETPPDTVGNIVEEMLSKGRVIFETIMIAKNKDKIPIEISNHVFLLNGRKTVSSIVRDVTERRLMEEKLRQSEKKCRELVEAANSIILTWDTAGNITFLNTFAERFFGFSKQELLGRNVVGTIVPPVESSGRDLAWMIEEIRRDPDRFKDNENENITKDGRRVWVRWANKAIIDERGTLFGILSVGNDITERKQAEEALRLTRFTVDNVADAVYWMNSKAQIVDVNETACSMLGYTREELLDLTVFAIDPDFTAERWANAWETLKGQGKITLETKHRTKDGRIIPVEIMANYLSFGGKELDCAFARDISQRKRAEEKLREREGKYRVLFESANDGIFIQDKTGFIDCNQKGAEMYGLSKEEIIGRLPSEFAPERQPDGRLSSEVAGEKIRAALSGVPQVFEWQPVRVDGSTFNVEITLSRLELGGEMCLQAIVRDITERKRLAQELLRGQKLEAIGTLAGGIAHDFNNLLQGLFGYISLAKLTHDQKEKSLAMLEQAEKALHMSVNLTTQLLTFSKGGKPVKKKMTLRPIIENAAKFALSGSGVDYRIEFDDGVWAAEVDEGQISQVIQNVVINADQAMPEGGTVVIAAKNVVGPDKNHPKIPHGNYVEISVQDTGIGIPGQYLQRIFDPYFTMKEKGSGLGLATSYSIIRNHDGLIDVVSELGRGTTFFIYLPAVEAGKEIDETTVASSAVRKGKILIMDDDNLVRSLAEELIKTLGHEVESAKDGIDAIEKFILARDSGKPFDVVILDLTVKSGMGGEQTIKELRETDPSVKAIVSSGYANNRVIADYHSYGFAAFLNKPYTIDSLNDRLNALLR